MSLEAQILELIRQASTDLPKDIEDAVLGAAVVEDDGSTAENVLQVCAENIAFARSEGVPICQDTGALTFYVDLPVGQQESRYADAIKKAVVQGTDVQYLRPNSVDVLTGKNPENNLGEKTPNIKFRQWDEDFVRIRLMLKGGGSENVGAQYKLPEPSLKAGRDLKGVRKVIIDAVHKAQGQGCAPGILGVCIGGDRGTSYDFAKEQLFRKVGERSSDAALADFETELVNDINKLGIGPMGFGGKTTVLEVFAATLPRHPATYYVSIVYMCWACRRKSMIIKDGEAKYD